MDLFPSEEQRELAAAARAVLAHREQVWRDGVAQGWLALGLEESAGGLGGALADEAQLYAEIGAAAAAGPFLATSIGIRVAAAEGETGLAAGLAGGGAWAGLGFAQDSAAEPLVAYDVRGASVLLLVDERAGTLRLVSVAETAIVEDVSPLDPAVTAARVRLDGLPVLAETGGGGAARELSRAAVLVAAMLAGISVAATDMSVEYARIREQFGKPIGAFQAISHRCAEMAIRSHAATAVTNLAAVSVDEDRPDARDRVAAARRYTESAASANARANIQNHGAIGFTWEHGAHRLLKRARFLALSFLPRPEQTAILAGSP
ncbi:MAG: acyl-CoA dehydrogenase family protein [Actinophytocola sp.]|uniref:acyl-CoA dehydrogenase family protein n=1 Tax=Actinophytocola sp. TaxID=1872138 RepID=UPI003C731111